MKVLIILVAMLILTIVNVQASEIVLKDGRTVKVKIFGQDKEKLRVSEDGFPVTYYNDEIISIDGRSFIEWNEDLKSGAEKEELIKAYAKLVPMSYLVSAWAGANLSPEQQKIFLKFFNDYHSSLALSRIRAQGLRRYYTTSELKAWVNFMSTPLGKEYLNDTLDFQNDTMRFIYKYIATEAKVIIRVSNSGSSKYPKVSSTPNKSYQQN